VATRDLEGVAFPTLDAAQVERLGQCAGASSQRFADGEPLFRVGDREFKFFVVKSGKVDIVDSSSGAPRTIAVHPPGAFTGDVSHLTGNPAVVSAYARGDCEVHAISTEALRRVLNECPDLCDIILQAFIARRQLLREHANFTGLRVIGSRYSQDTFRIREFLAKNRVLFTWLDLESDPEVGEVLKQFGVTEEETPVVACGRMVMHRNPSNRELAEEIGVRRPLERLVYDLAIVGAGPAGLAAAVYGASEGLDTVLLDRMAPGGQAGVSMRIENYLGFPSGLTGAELTDRAVLQANRFGAHLSVPTAATQLSFDQAYAILELDSGETIVAKCLLVATGAEYRRLPVADCEQFEGRGVYYAATPNEVQVCKGAEAIVVGAGNSAGQAAVYLASQARRVYLVVRGGDLYKNMSSYLARRIEHTSNVEILYDTEVQAMHGNGQLGGVELVNSKTGARRSVECPGLFSFIGAVPRTNWLPSEVETDEHGFVLTGPALTQSKIWPEKRQPFLLETSRPGTFAAGDVRSGSVKRVASAVGEGAMAVQFVHEYLKTM
jgi:thioredoxin reductase (NADPH)